MSDYRKISLFLLRHGQCEGGEMVRGRTDVALTALGMAQMRASWQTFAARVPEGSVLATSPLIRCHGFADTLAGRVPFAGALVRCDWAREMDFGQWDGLAQSDVYRRWPALADGFWRGLEHHTPPDGEPKADFCQRVLQGWQGWLGELAGAQAPGAVLVCHGGVIRVLLSHILQPEVLPGAPWFTSLDLPYGAAVELTIYLGEGQPPFYRLHWPCLMS